MARGELRVTEVVQEMGIDKALVKIQEPRRGRGGKQTRQAQRLNSTRTSPSPSPE